ncbi:MAG: chromate transporter, partial [Actinobacteria bacterium]|nr:chromate transporter [Actinomycetota bacterium]
MAAAGQAAGSGPPAGSGQAADRVPLLTIARQWGRIGCTGFGGPPAHIALLRKLCVADRGWLPEREFEDGIAAVNLLPGPASTQLAIYCAWRLRGTAGALVGGACFIVPGLVVILALAVAFLAARPPGWVAGAALGAGAAVPAVAVAAAVGLVPASWRRASGTGAADHGRRRLARLRWACYLA